LENKPRSELCTVPRTPPLRVVLRCERAENVRLVDVLSPKLQDSLALGRHFAPLQPSVLALHVPDRYRARASSAPWPRRHGFKAGGSVARSPRRTDSAADGSLHEPILGPGGSN